ncbi:hypothetical protein SUGI_0991920 [Cryptomeria japonica]|nr:hypothetical protein SUGI_0991920 [Cryptomeria japonica]
MRAGVSKLKVCFEVGADGILTVSVLNMESGNSKQITIYNENRSLSKEEIDRMVAEAHKFRIEDEAAKEKQT